MSSLLYIRHAQASYGADDYDQLSEKGYEQSSILGEHLVEKKIIFDDIYIGPLKRHAQTFEEVRSAYNKAGIPIPEPKMMPELEEHRGPEILRECSAAIRDEDSDIKRWDDERIKDPSLFRRNGLLIFEKAMLLWATGQLQHHQPDHYLDWSAFRQQTKGGFQKVHAAHKADKKRTIGLFTSGGTISATMGHVLGMKEDADIIGLNGIVINTSVTEVLFSGDRVTLKRFNDTSHLPEHMKTYV